MAPRLAPSPYSLPSTRFGERLPAWQQKEVSRDPRTGFVVGAYCIEDEVILRRELDFPDGIAVGDTLAIPNTAGYFMHILESASHQIPLARNVYSEGGEWVPDDIDAT